MRPHGRNTLSDFDGVAHDVNDFRDFPDQFVVIPSETVANAVLNTNHKFEVNFLWCVLVAFCWIERFVWGFDFNVIRSNPKRLDIFSTNRRKPDFSSGFSVRNGRLRRCFGAFGL